MKVLTGDDGTCWSLGCKKEPTHRTIGDGPLKTVAEVCEDHAEAFVAGGWDRAEPITEGEEVGPGGDA